MLNDSFIDECEWVSERVSETSCVIVTSLSIGIAFCCDETILVTSIALGMARLMISHRTTLSRMAAEKCKSDWYDWPSMQDTHSRTVMKSASSFSWLRSITCDNSDDMAIEGWVSECLIKPEDSRNATKASLTQILRCYWDTARWEHSEMDQSKRIKNNNFDCRDWIANDCIVFSSHSASTYAHVLIVAFGAIGSDGHSQRT